MLEKSFSFLRLLQQNNNREWYHANKDIYNEAKTEFEQLTELLIHEIGAFDRSIVGLTPKDCIFRIFRDVRFSANKMPYKTNFGTFIVPAGKKSGFAGYYLHIEPQGSFIAAGIHMPPSPVLKALRQDVYEHIDEFKDIINNEELNSYFDGLFGEKLKTAPRGFPKDFQDIEYLRYKSYGVSGARSDADIQNSDSFEKIINSFEAAKPLIGFLNEAISKVQEK